VKHGYVCEGLQAAITCASGVGGKRLSAALRELSRAKAAAAAMGALHNARAGVVFMLSGCLIVCNGVGVLIDQNGQAHEIREEGIGPDVSGGLSIGPVGGSSEFMNGASNSVGLALGPVWAQHGAGEGQDGTTGGGGGWSVLGGGVGVANMHSYTNDVGDLNPWF
jgi:hypothetical protein